MLATPTLTSAPLNPASDIIDLSVYRVPPLLFLVAFFFFFFFFSFCPQREDRPSGKEEGRSNECRNGDRINRIDVRFNVGHPVDIYSSVYSCPVFRYDVFFPLIIVHHGKNGSPKRVTLAITLRRNPRAEFLLLRAEQLIVTISVV